MIEIATGVFAGNPGTCIRNRLWPCSPTASAIEAASNEQGWAVRAAGRDRGHPIDYDRLILFAHSHR